MTTPRDLLIVSLDVSSAHPVGQGDLSLALAGAELVDLLRAGALALDGERVVPGADPAEPEDRLLREAGASLRREVPYESVEDWLWRRGEGLAAAYHSGLEADGLLVRQRHPWIRVRTGRTALTDSPARNRAALRWRAGDPVLVGLAAALGIHDEPAEDFGALADESLVTVLAAVHHAVAELEAVRQRRSIEKAAFDNIWRG
ncbi:GOLPH3/VPS74 family protein [Streptomyces griseoaurantiacus]|uniref:GPP34 family phosphoprotein n=1 Tax=Streptomyces griseoaurantiacus TaxID=68213 RepID=A0A7W2DPC7_9ACTN|nr:GPP34 family phosphoprotein [Streptomyces griseoaurantiacus]MBA5220514.1 GPP34 family phosphoprotein [Streptomyces griseoaurantiacus]